MSAGENFRDYDQLEVILVATLPSVEIMAYNDKDQYEDNTPPPFVSSSSSIGPKPTDFTFNMTEFEELFGPVVDPNGTIFKVDQWRGNEIVVTGKVIVWPSSDSLPPFGHTEPSSMTGNFQDGDRITPYRTLPPTVSEFDC